LGNTPLGEGGSHGKVGSFTRFRAFVPPARVSTELVVQIAPSAFDPGASQFLSRRSVLKEQSKIARHFNAGKGLENSSPAGTVEKKHRFQPSLRDWTVITSDPGVQTPGYFQNVSAGRSFFGCLKIEMPMPGCARWQEICLLWRVTHAYLRCSFCCLIP
jgi:hypothetical protein